MEMSIDSFTIIIIIIIMLRAIDQMNGQTRIEITLPQGRGLIE